MLSEIVHFKGANFGNSKVPLLPEPRISAIFGLDADAWRALHPICAADPAHAGVGDLLNANPNLSALLLAPWPVQEESCDAHRFGATVFRRIGHPQLSHSFLQ